MVSLIIAFSLICLLLLAILAIAWRRTDWKEIEKANERFLDENGEHDYYDHFKNRKR